MTRHQQRSRTRTWVLVNYLTVLTVIALPQLARTVDLVALWVAVLLALVAVLSVSFVRAFSRTGLWTLTHVRPASLDERERELTHSALATSYRWMAVTTLVAIYLVILANDPATFAWFGWLKPVAAVLAVGLIYVAHTLPAALIGWTELPPDETTGWQPTPAGQ